jgi:hypothetical protein
MVQEKKDLLMIVNSQFLSMETILKQLLQLIIKFIAKHSTFSLNKAVQQLN